MLVSTKFFEKHKNDTRESKFLTQQKVHIQTTQFLFLASLLSLLKAIIAQHMWRFQHYTKYAKKNYNVNVVEWCAVVHYPRTWVSNLIKGFVWLSEGDFPLFLNYQNFLWIQNYTPFLK